MNRTDLKDLDKVELAHEITVGMYKAWEQEQNRDEIAKFIYQRFTERYLNPVNESSHRNGFAMMAVACLMIEALESFHQGWKNTKNKNGGGGKIFEDYFKRYPDFGIFAGFGSDFYRCIRCGILHQAETAEGWLIHRNSQPSDPKNKIVNADDFITALERTLKGYCKNLKSADWNDPLWENFRLKMASIIDNCKR